MASLEGIRAPTRADSDAPVGLTWLPRGTVIGSGLGPAKGPVRLLFDLLRAVTSSSGGTSDGRRSLGPEAEASRIVQWVPQLLR